MVPDQIIGVTKSGRVVASTLTPILFPHHDGIVCGNSVSSSSHVKCSYCFVGASARTIIFIRIKVALAVDVVDTSIMLVIEVELGSEFGW
jgi:hypothetical protein